MTGLRRQAGEEVAGIARQAINLTQDGLAPLARSAAWLDPRSEDLTLTLLDTLQQVNAQASQLLYALQAAQYQEEAEAAYIKQRNAALNTSAPDAEETEPIEGEDR